VGTQARRSSLDCVRAARLVPDRGLARPGEWPLTLLYELLGYVERTLEHLFRDAAREGMVVLSHSSISVSPSTDHRNVLKPAEWITATARAAQVSGYDAGAGCPRSSPSASPDSLLMTWNAPRHRAPRDRSTWLGLRRFTPDGRRTLRYHFCTTGDWLMPPSEEQRLVPRRPPFLQLYAAAELKLSPQREAPPIEMSLQHPWWSIGRSGIGTAGGSWVR
jgi:hypothetical protein